MKILVLSDIHGNISALNAVLNDSLQYNYDSVICLGDLIDYGAHSNEIIEKLKTIKKPFICNLQGNHENAIINEDYARFSSPRGVESAIYTRSVLNSVSYEYITKNLREGEFEFNLGNKKCLAVHGSIKDIYWKSITPEVVAEEYKDYDYVFSGHSHIPHYFEKFVYVDNPKMRNKKKIVFLNPGSVGQPRNHNTFAQYAIFDSVTETVMLNKVKYDIFAEQKDISSNIDEFYKKRLEVGI